MEFTNQILILSIFMLIIAIVSMHMAANSSKNSTSRQINTTFAVLAIIFFFAMCCLCAKHTLG